MRSVARGEFLKLAGATLLSGLLPGEAQACAQESGTLQGSSQMSERPNILILLSDDQPYWFQQYMTKTNAVLSQGMTFENACCSSPLCAPSRASIQTGMNSTRTKIKVNKNAATRFIRDGWRPDNIGAILARDAGYKCGYFGKWMNAYEEIPAFEGDGYHGWNKNITTWAVTLGNRNPVKANINGSIRKTNVARHYETQWFGNRARAFIESATELGEPWLCFASANAPHYPYDPSPAYKDTLSGLGLPDRPNIDAHDPNKPDYISSLPPLTNTQKAGLGDTYQGKREELLDLDDAVDNILSVVDFENTYVFYLTDNGFLLGEHRIARGSSAKGEPYEESLRTPLMVRGPAVVESSTTSRLAANIDIAPTILELAGIEAGPDGYDMDGRSLLPLLVGASEPEWRDGLLVELVASEAGNTGWSGLRYEDRIYVERQSGFREYYDLAADPYQLTNLAPSTDPVALYEMGSRLSRLKQASGEDLRSAEVATTV